MLVNIAFTSIILIASCNRPHSTITIDDISVKQLLHAMHTIHTETSSASLHYYYISLSLTFIPTFQVIEVKSPASLYSPWIPLLVINFMNATARRKRYPACNRRSASTPTLIDIRISLFRQSFTPCYFHLLLTRHTRDSFTRQLDRQYAFAQHDTWVIILLIYDNMLLIIVSGFWRHKAGVISRQGSLPW